ncbi:MAG: hypothetical protein JNM18_01445 [Planctomycetaceae bacterium]|nr:hypothetical protein [Planctomycetaceae bacterium]
MNERQFLLIFIFGSFYTFVLGVALYFGAQWAQRKRWWPKVWAVVIPVTLLWSYHIALAIERLQSRPPPGWGPDRPPAMISAMRVTQVGLWGTFYLISGVVPLIVCLWWNPFRKHWPRFNLRQMFYFVAVLSACIAGITWSNTYGPHGTQRPSFWYRHGFVAPINPDGTIRALWYEGIYLGQRVPFDRSLMPLIGNLRSLRELRLTEGSRSGLPVPITDEDLACLRPLINLRVLSIESPHITDASIDTLTSFQKLRGLYLYKTTVTNKTGEALLKMPELRSVGYPPGWSEEMRDRVSSYCAARRARDRE